MRSEDQPSLPQALPVLVAALAFFSIIAVLPKDAFWITDEGNRFIQVQSMARWGGIHLAVEYPAQDLDPGRRFFPYGGHHFQRVAGRIYSFYPFYFPLLSLPLFRWLGTAGIYVLPALGGLLCLILSRKLGLELRLSDPRGLVPLALAFGTPLWFYSVTFWEHSLASALAVGGVIALVRSAGGPGRFASAFFAGLLLAGSTALREESYGLVVAMALGFGLAFRPGKRLWLFVLGWGVGMTPVWLIQRALFGSFFGLHAAVYRSSPDPLPRLLLDKLGNFPVYFFQCHSSGPVSFALALPLLAAAVAGLSGQARKHSALRLWTLAGVALSSAAFLILVLQSGDPVLGTLATQGLLPAVPFLALFLLDLRETASASDPAARFLAITSLVAMALIGALLNRKDMGIIWGPRHFLALLPFLVLLSWRAVSRRREEGMSLLDRRGARVAVAALLLVSLGIQIHGLRLLWLKKQGTKEILEVLRRAAGEIIITDTYWLPEELAAIFIEKKILFVQSDADLAQALTVIRSRHAGPFAFATSRRYGLVSDPAFRRLASLAGTRQAVRPAGLPFMELAVLSGEIPAEGWRRADETFAESP